MEADEIEQDLRVPGTELLVDLGKSPDSEHADAGRFSHVILIPQPTECGGDPLTWPRWKKYYQLFLVSLYACVMSFGENTLGAAWTTVSLDTGVSLTNLNGGSALNYLLLGFANVLWIPLAHKAGRRCVLLATSVVCVAAAAWGGCMQGAAQWYLENVLNGVGTAAYEAVIQLCIFDMFYVHERGRMLSVYLFGQQLGSILGLISGGTISDTTGWRWGQFIVAILQGAVLALLFLSFEETLFPRFLFAAAPAPNIPNIPPVSATPAAESPEKRDGAAGGGDEKKLEGTRPAPTTTDDVRAGAVVDPYPRRTYLETLRPWTYDRRNRTTYWQYFRRPFFLWAFPNIIIAGFIFAFGCTAGIVTFNTASEILTAPPYSFSTTATGLIFLAALVGSAVGWATGALSDYAVLLAARRNGGVREPEARLWALLPCAAYAGLGYGLYGWGAQAGTAWPALAVGVGALIAHQVGAGAVATAYAMDCFPGVAGELVVVLAVCSSCVNFAVSYAVQPFVSAAGYGWPFTAFGLCALGSMAMAVPLGVWGKRWRRRAAPRYWSFLDEVEGSGG